MTFSRHKRQVLNLGWNNSKQ